MFQNESKTHYTCPEIYIEYIYLWNSAVKYIQVFFSMCIKLISSLKPRIPVVFL